MATATTSPDITDESAPARKRRKLSKDEHAVQLWIRQNYGVLSEVARSIDPPVSVQFVFHVAYARDGRKSKGLRVERELKRRGCPLIQKIR